MFCVILCSILRPMRRTDLTGRHFGRLTVKRFLAFDQHHKAHWLCLCICGGTCTPATHALTSGATQSCGCLQRERTSRCRKTHGGSKAPLYHIWSSMIQRCHTETNHQYSNYGGRGIRVCSRWRQSFAAFRDDIGPRPSKRHTIERIDNNGPYAPKNCRWATRPEQALNTRRNRLLTFNGSTKPLKVWANETKIDYTTLLYRLLRGWTIQEALTIQTLRTGQHR